MTKVSGLGLLILLGLHVVQGSLVDITKMIRYVTGNAPRKYVGYGNYCGPLGKGEVKDEIDRCCLEHDRCLKRVNRRECKFTRYISFFVIDYKWDVVDDQIVCNDLNSSCSAKLCECDKIAALCVANHDHRYDPVLKRPVIKIPLKVFS